MTAEHTVPVIEPDFSTYIQRHSADKTFAYKKVGKEDLSLGAFFPKNYDAAKKYPVFLCIHGGGWHSHKIFADQTEWSGDYLGFLARYYADKGFFAVSIDYRLLQAHGQKKGFQLSDLTADCIDALGFVKAREKAWGLDFSRSVLLGESAGGYLAAALATFKRDFSCEIEAAILVNAICDMTDAHWGGYLPAEITDVKPFSPVHRIDESTPPVLLIHGREDHVVLPAHSRAFYNRMQIYRRPAELHIIEETDHAFLLAEFMRETDRSAAAAGACLEIIDNFLQKTFPSLKL